MFDDLDSLFYLSLDHNRLTELQLSSISGISMVPLQGNPGYPFVVPTVTLTSDVSTVAGDGTVTITATFSEAVQGFDPADGDADDVEGVPADGVNDIKVTGGTLVADSLEAVGDDGTTYTFQIAPIDDATSITVSVNAGAAVDLGCNPNTASNTVSVTVTPPAAPAAVSGFDTTFAAPEGVPQVTMAWDALGDDRVTKFQYRQRSGPDWGSWTDTPDSDKDTTSYTVSVQSLRAYSFQVRAVAGTVNGEESVVRTENIPAI